LNLFHDLKVRQKILLPMLIALLVIILLAGVFVERIEEDHAVMQQIRHSEGNLNALHQLREDLLNIETGERGFLLTGDLSFLEPYLLGMEHFRSDLETVRARLSEHPHVREMLLEIEKTSNHLFLSVMEPLVSQRKQAALSNNPEAENRALKLASSMENARIGKKLMDQLRIQFVRMIEIESTHLKQLQNSLVQTSRFTIWVLAGALLLSVLILLWIGLWMAQKISVPLQELTQASNAIAEGDMKQQIVPLESGDEIGELHRAIVRMRDHLVHTVARLESEKLAARSGGKRRGIVAGESWINRS